MTAFLELGPAGAGGVMKARWLGIPCAKKEFHTAVEMAIFVREAGILCRLSHPNIVNFFCCSNGPKKGLLEQQHLLHTDAIVEQLTRTQEILQQSKVLY